MRIAVFADVHANLAALEAVMADIDSVGVDERWCLGDMVGRGVFPRECLEIIERGCQFVLEGNHDYWCSSYNGILEFTGSLIADPLVLALQECTPDQIDWLRELQPSGSPIIGFDAVHASLRDPLMEFIGSPDEARAQMNTSLFRGRLLYAHTHDAVAWYEGPDGVVYGHHPTSGEAWNIPSTGVLLNPGSVGCRQERGSRDASWMLLDVTNEQQTATWRSVPYDQTQNEERLSELDWPLSWL